MTLIDSSQDNRTSSLTEQASTQTEPTPQPPVIAVRRRTIDSVLIGLGAVTVAVLVVAGGLLTWGHNFASDYVGRELGSQNIYFPDRAGLEQEGRSDLFSYAGQQVTTGNEAQAYASYISHHLDATANGATYADLGAPESTAKAAVVTAKTAGQDAAVVADLQAKADTITNQRNTLFKGETLRGLLLSTFAWSTIGLIAGIAAIAAFLAAGVMAALVALGMVHRRKLHAA
jgi:hypothetical protein